MNYDNSFPFLFLAVYEYCVWASKTLAEWLLPLNSMTIAHGHKTAQLITIGMSSTAVACHISLASDILYYTTGNVSKGEAIPLKSLCPLTQAPIWRLLAKVYLWSLIQYSSFSDSHRLRVVVVNHHYFFVFVFLWSILFYLLVLLMSPFFLLGNEPFLPYFFTFI